ncbi:MAG TPA: nitroreductase family protein [Anaerolineae bacterium]|nr:nitroreductase family protein [Anaerolineae bacterium]HMR63517.1 nitroreductase family protein [Anaerolineae bacterium]
MELLDAIRSRKTTNGPLRADPVSKEHQKLLIEAASRAPSHFNSQPWRFILIEDETYRQRIAEIGGQTMTQLMAEGRFFQRYRKYFRFSRAEMEQRRDGILIDQLPAPLRPFLRHIFSDKALALMNKLGVPKTLGQDNTKLVQGSPLILAALLTKEEYKPDDLSGFYCLLSLGMAIENIWLLCGDLGLGIQFVSTPMEVPEAWQEIKSLLQVPDDLELMALYRIGYLPDGAKRPRIDWTSSQRKTMSQLAYRNVVSPETRWPEDE